MAYERCIYSRINWLNKSESLTTPLGKTNLNKMDSAIYQIAENLDVVHEEFGTGKFDKADADKVIAGMPTWNPNTGVLSFQFYDGTTFQVDFNVEKIPVSFSMDSAGVITMTTADGTQWTANIGDVVPDYTFDDSETIAFAKGYDWDTSQYSQIDAYGYGPPDHWAVPENRDRVYLDRSSGIAYACAYDGKKYFLATSQLQRIGKNVRVCGEIKKGSIMSEHLQPDYLADVSAQAGDAAANAKEASDFADNAAFDAKLAQSYAVGGSGVRQGEDADNAKKYKELCQGIYDNMQQAGSVTGVKGAAEDAFRGGNVNITPENIGAMDIQKGNALENAINKISADLVAICCDAVNVTIPNHDASLIFIKLGKRCLVMARHHVKGAAWDTASSGIYIPAEYRPGSTKYLSGTKYTIALYDNGVIGLWGETGVDLWESGCASYDCAN
ncbi:MAG: hypothetical protein HFH62_11120 [Lachnospiraceae bacterium]|nr:hypothetical protein [Lachnospiraceae bacterium]